MSNKSLFEGIPAALAALPRWVRWEYHSVNGKKTKVPITMAGALASTTDPTTWTSLQSVNEFDKIGFVFVKEDGIVGIDLDHVLVEGEPVAWARAVVADASSYTEGSPSGSGLHIIGTGAKPAWLPNRIDMPGEAGIEIYDHGRYFTMTGRVFEGHCELAAIDVESLLWWVKDLLPREQSSVPTTTKRKLSADLNIPVTAIVNVRPGKRVPHPFHESSTGCNFMINANDQTWRCWRHSFTGNALHLLGIKYSIISCGEKPSKEQWRKIIGKARKEGLVKAQLRIYEGRRGT